MGWSFMTVATEKEEPMDSSGQDINPINPSKYSCQILLEKTTLAEANDKSFPSDAYLVWYNLDGKEHLDLVRCRKQVELFDMYYDKYGPNVLKRIDYGYGQRNPKTWGAKAPDKKKKK